MRNPNPFTDRQIKLLEAIHDKLTEINDPDPDIIRHDSYEFTIELTKQFSKIPKLKFSPKSCQIKAELLEKAGLVSESREKELSEIREKYGIYGARNKEARRFDSEWNNIMLKAKKAAFTLAYLNQLFALENQQVSDPIAQIQQIVMEEYGQHIKAKTPIYTKEPEQPKSSYKDELMEVE